jgi:hypothetical protein
MSLAQLFSLRSLVGDRSGVLAERVASRSRLQVWQRVKDVLSQLKVTEARGYIRARALPIIKEETDRLIEQDGVKAARYREAIVEKATELLIRTILAQIEQSAKETAKRRAA